MKGGIMKKVVRDSDVKTVSIKDMHSAKIYAFSKNSHVYKLSQTNPSGCRENIDSETWQWLSMETSIGCFSSEKHATMQEAAEYVMRESHDIYEFSVLTKFCRWVLCVPEEDEKQKVKKNKARTMNRRT